MLLKLSLGSLVDSERGDILEGLTAGELYGVLQRVFSGLAYFAIKRIDWESIRDRIDAENEVIRSL